jgi:hypothetical protein
VLTWSMPIEGCCSRRACGEPTERSLAWGSAMTVLPWCLLCAIVMLLLPEGSLFSASVGLSVGLMLSEQSARVFGHVGAGVFASEGQL